MTPRESSCARSSIGSSSVERGDNVATITVRSFGSLEESLAACRELDDAILDLRFNDADLGTWVLRTEGAAADVLAADRGRSIETTGSRAKSACSGNGR